MKRITLAVLFVFVFVIEIFAAEITIYNTENSGLIDNQVNAIYIDENGTKWFGTASGVCSFNNEDWYSQNTVDALANVNVNDIDFEESSYGPELWIATTTGAGVGSYNIDAITSATRYTAENSDLTGDNVTTVDVDIHNARWFGTAGHGVSVFAGSDWYSFTEENDYLTSNNVAVIASGDSFHYVGTLGGSVSRLKYLDDIDAVTEASPYDTDWSGIFSKNVYAIVVMNNGDQWFGTDNGLMFHDTTETKRGWHRFDPDSNNVADIKINTLALGNDSKLWVGTPSGVSFLDQNDNFVEIRMDKADFTTITEADGLPDNNVVDIAVDTTNGDVWFATANGVACLSGEWTSVTEPDAPVARSYQLLSNYPNPFNPSTTISIEVPFNGNVMLDVFNINGQRVRRLANNKLAAGTYQLSWDGMNELGQQVNSGVYFLQLFISNQMEQMSASHKMLLVK